LCERFAVPEDRPFLLVTFHPATAGAEPPLQQVAELLAALSDFTGHFTLFTRAGADAGGQAVNTALEGFVAGRPQNAALVASLGMRGYLSAMRAADAVVGNSSSGVIEAPALKTPAVNIGDRQAGRVRAASVIDCPPRAGDIRHAIETAITPAFRQSLKSMQHPLQGPGTAAAIVRTLREIPLEGLLQKTFHDLDTLTA
jgi:UDP-hydrolysing UDP-N-acetyl-D-glucosamine 2-epimerase